jgi:hypothetical protein
MGKPIYETHSLHQSLHVIAARLFSLFVVTSAVVNYNENPAATTLAILLFGAIFVFAGQGSLIIYEDRIEREFSYTLSLIGYKRIYYYRDIKSVTVYGNGTFENDIIFDMVPRLGVRFVNKVEITMNDGTIKTIRTRTYKKQLMKAVKSFSEAFDKYKNGK